ncbi:dUTP diphosphatase [Vibrio aestuarianus]|uniref:dUTP diphosphatase n=1 Tax=Vibrio aestuarianus TaxID=28171 RepID=UPI0021C3A4BC|nr:dUTP diphosphatase [Vibrio aestuarianus]MDE1211084.1 dUTP diphosphatase [Vibrio aestuarianus]MDE1254173.1 dUTP diphosphatase [Vibrio aestuarianus]MDE1319374.1 dUTP diphosphatase [Vibrio aestuarianus]MDE1326500.1 dUTP diphosphatase [Vibrio aestuarianus]CAH8188712.1 conserved hypothetical protein [Vibrio aestuarianus]
MKNTSPNDIYSQFSQALWFPGTPENRYIFDFRNNVLEILESDGVLSEDAFESVGNTITQDEDSVSLYLIGKSLVDQHFRVVDKSNNLFKNTTLTQYNLVFSKEINQTTEYLDGYYVSYNALNFFRVSQNQEFTEVIQHDVIDLPHRISQDSPLSVIAHEKLDKKWIFYTAYGQFNLNLHIAECNGSNIKPITSVPLPNEFDQGQISIEVSATHIAILKKGYGILYGDVRYSDTYVDLEFRALKQDVSVELSKCAISLDDQFLVYISTEGSSDYINWLNLTTEQLSTQKLLGRYSSLKTSPIANIYGLSPQQAEGALITLLELEPEPDGSTFIVNETYSPVSGGFFPNCEFKVIAG